MLKFCASVMLSVNEAARPWLGIPPSHRSGSCPFWVLLIWLGGGVLSLCDAKMTCSIAAVGVTAALQLDASIINQLKHVNSLRFKTAAVSQDQLLTSGCEMGQISVGTRICWPQHIWGSWWIRTHLKVIVKYYFVKKQIKWTLLCVPSSNDSMEDVCTSWWMWENSSGGGSVRCGTHCVKLKKVWNCWSALSSDRTLRNEGHSNYTLWQLEFPHFFFAVERVVQGKQRVQSYCCST